MQGTLSIPGQRPDRTPRPPGWPGERACCAAGSTPGSLMAATKGSKSKAENNKKWKQQNSNTGLWSSSVAGPPTLSLDISYVHSFGGSTGRSKDIIFPSVQRRQVMRAVRRVQHSLTQVTIFSWQYFCSVTAKYQEIWHMPGKDSFQLYPFNGFLNKNITAQD